MTPKGGTELLYSNLVKYCGQDWYNVNLVLSLCNPSLLLPNKINVLWQHLYHDQQHTLGMNDAQFLAKVDHFVYVSNWQLQQFKNVFNIADLSNRVIKNAVEPIQFVQKPKNRIKLIYTSMPNRGLSVLMDAFDLLNDGSIELTIYSSNIIYGKGYSDAVREHYDQLFHRCRNTKNVKYVGYATNLAVRKTLINSHILAYPSIFKETSCLSAIEAGAAGLKIVTTDYGALPETCDRWATYVPYTENYNELVHDYAETLRHEIESYDFDKLDQSNWFNVNYGWTNRAIEWKNFFEEIK